METNAFVLLIPLTIIILFSGPLYRQFMYKDQDIFQDISKTDSLLALMEKEKSLHRRDLLTDTVPFHAFDPNVISEQELISLQLKKEVASRIVRYREKGGHFYKKEDLLRIFGMDTAWFERAEKHIVIKSNRPLYEQKKFPQRKVLQAAGDINTADSLQLVDVFGIGPVLAKRIVTFRDRLGGFVSMDQLREVYGLDSTVVKSLKRKFEVKDGFKPKMIMLNDASLEDLTNHPYIKRREAQAILAYRLQHGSFDSVGQLGNIKLLDPKWIARMRSYVSVRDQP